MPYYVAIERFDGDWRNKGKGRRVQCPKCGLGVRVHVRVTAGMCTRCRRALMVLTETPRGVSSQGENPAPVTRESPANAEEVA